jgi:hypothetical protein
MVNFNRDQSTFIDNKRRDVQKETKVGKVTRVYEHTDQVDDNNFAVNVTVNGETREENIVPLTSSSPNSIQVPKVGDSVVLEYLNGETPRPVVTGFTPTPDSRPPLGRAGMDRKELESGESDMGQGNVYVTQYSRLGEKGLAAFTEDTSDGTLKPKEVFVRIAKRASNTEADPSEDDTNVKLEFHDTPGVDSDSYIEASASFAGGETKDRWGMKINISQGKIKFSDANGFGIESDGNGNFKWSHQNIDFVEEDSGSIEL